MKRVLAALETANQWVSRNLLYIIIVCGIIMFFIYSMVAHYGEKVEKIVDSGKVLSTDSAKVLIQQKKADKDTADKYKDLAITYKEEEEKKAKKVKLLQLKTDSLKRKYESLPAAATVPYPYLTRYFADYQSPFQEGAPGTDSRYQGTLNDGRPAKAAGSH